MGTSALGDRAVIEVGGDGARAFLQGLITNDMNECGPGRPIYAALLTPQGKLLYDFVVIERDGSFIIDCASAMAADLLKRLTMYRLRAKIALTPRDDLTVRAGWDDPTPADAFSDPRLTELGWRMVAPRAGASMDYLGAYHARRLSLGVPDSADMPPHTTFPLDAGFEELHGVSFKKGCYVGQEVTARMKHRATARRRMLITDVDGALPAPGTPVLAGGKEIGTLATGIGSRALAMIRLDRLQDAEAAHTTVTAAAQRVTLVKPDWLSL